MDIRHPLSLHLNNQNNQYGLVMINKIKGTQDFIETSLFNFTINAIKSHLEKYNFTEIITPILEPTELYIHSLGTQTDIVKKQMYTFGEDNKTCLRPEGTSSMVRAFVENHIEQVPWKVFEFAQCFRYERPQKGRYREFRQVSVEIIGSENIAQDAWLIKTLDTLFSDTFKLNTYALQLNFLGVPEDRKKYKTILYEFLSKNETQLCKTCLERKESNIMRVFDCKEESCQKIYLMAPKITDFLCASSAAEWQKLKQQLDLLSVSYNETPTLVRGLDYYNKTVFEFVSNDLGAQSAFCGGGRYDYLVTQAGGAHDQPSIGAGIGFDRLLLLLEPKRNQLALAQSHALTVIVPIEPEQNSLALLIADLLTQQGICTDILVDSTSVKSKMRKANKMGARWTIIIGPDEQKNQTAVLKNMLTGTEESVIQTVLINKIK